MREREKELRSGLYVVADSGLVIKWGKFNAKIILRGNITWWR